MPDGKKRKRALEGDVISIALPQSGYAFGRVLTDPLMAFYDLQSDTVPPVEAILAAPIAFKVCVAFVAAKTKGWEIVEHAPLSDDLKEEPLFFKKDSFTGKLTIYRDSTGKEFPATLDECAKLECAAVWEPEHVVDRLVDHFAGRPNRWVESMRP